MDQTHIRGPAVERRTPAGAERPRAAEPAAIPDHRPSAGHLRDLAQLAHTGPAATAQRQRMAFSPAPQRPAGPPVVQRNAATLTHWIGTRGGSAGVGHNLVDAGVYVVVNDALDITDAFWQELSARDPGHLDELLQAAVALGAAANTLGAIPGPLQTVVNTAQSTAGGRMRFRLAIGPTAAATSDVETFVAARIAPAYPGGLPAFITNMTPLDRQRLYDLPNAGRTPADDDAAIAWAVARNPTSVPQLVNYAEYFHAEKGQRELAAATAANQQKDLEVLAGTHDVAPGDLRVAPKALELAQRALAGAESARLGRFLGQLRRGAPLTGPNVTAIQTSPGYGAITTASTLADLEGARDAKAAAGAAAELGARGPHYTALAQAALKGEDIAARLLVLTNQQRAAAEAQLAVTMQASVATATIPAVNIPGFWALAGAPQQQAAISLAATNHPIPFGSPDGAAYHALKHYADIRNTAEAAAVPGQELQAYLDSARETLRNPAGVDVRQGQLYERPSFFFRRTVPAPPGGGGATQAMKAIVAVTGAGDVLIATYFRG